MNKKQSIAVLFATWPRKDSEQPMEVLVKAYEAALLYCEPWSVDMAVGRFIRGAAKGHDMAFRPTGPQVAQLATTLQSEEGRINDIQQRVSDQTNRIEYKEPPKEVKVAQATVWNRIRRELEKPNIHELAQEYMRLKWSTPRTVFDVDGAHFPDGTHHSVEEMRLRLNEPPPNTEAHLEWQEAIEKLQNAH